LCRWITFVAMCMCALGSTGGCSRGSGVNEVWKEDPWFKDSIGPPRIRMVIDILDGIQAELLMTGLCKGGEEIQIGISRSPTRPHVLRVVYRVPNVLQVFREAYIQEDGQVFLAEGTEGLNWRDQDTRGWVRMISDDRYRACYSSACVKIEVKLDITLTEGERERQRHRDAILQTLKYGVPPPDDYYDKFNSDSEDGEDDGDDSEVDEG